MHTTNGHRDFAAGEPFCWAPGHAPEALEDSEYVDFSPTEEHQHVIEHIIERAAEPAQGSHPPKDGGEGAYPRG